MADESTVRQKYFRQLPLMDEIIQIQDRCAHELALIDKSSAITCTKCGALWIK
jgi:hypothetical protein